MQPLRTLLIAFSLTILLPRADGAEAATNRLADSSAGATLDLRTPMRLGAQAIVRRLDPAHNFRPWFLLRGQGGVPVSAEHAAWDLGDMTGRYLESLIQARHMGVTDPAFSQAEDRLGRYMLSLLGSDGLVHDPDTGATDHCFSQGSALYGLLAWYEDSADPAVRRALESMVSGLLRKSEARGDMFIEPTAKLAEASGSHLAGYQIYPVIRFYELTGYPDALVLAEGRTRWAIADPVLGPNGEITKALSWEGHIHSWLDTLAGCVRTARNSSNLDRTQVVERCRAVYDWVRKSNGTSFGWIATYPTGGSCETCAISSAIRLALELAATGHPEYLDDVERFVRNQVVEAQFRDLTAYRGGPKPPSPLLLGCFDSQSMPNCHLGTRGGEDVGNVEGCCLNGGMRALALAWDAIQVADENGLTVNFGLSRNGPAGQVIGFDPFEGRVDVVPRVPGAVRVRIPGWVLTNNISVLVNNQPQPWRFGGGFVALDKIAAGARVSIRYRLRDVEESVSAGGQQFKVRWRGNTLIEVSPRGGPEPTYQNRLAAANWQTDSSPLVPDAYELQDAARLAESSMLARLDLQRSGQPFFRIYPFADPPRAEHEKWDDGDIAGRYVEGLILARNMTGCSVDPRELVLRSYLAGLFDSADGLCYTAQTEWTPRRACMFSQSSAMLGLLAWYRNTGSLQARRLLDRQVDGLLRIATNKDDYSFFPKYEFDGKQFTDDPKDRNAPAWYAGRLILPLVDFWQLSGRKDVKEFITRLVKYSLEASNAIGPDGEVRGTGWWGHLHGTMDMMAGIAEFGRLTHQQELLQRCQSVYDWIGRTHTARNGWVADSVGSSTCESCAIASRIRLALALYRAGVLEPFGEIDRLVRNQLLENQFVDLSFLPTPKVQKRTDRTTYSGIEQMIRGTFQCWANANDLIGNDDIEGCGAGGGVQALALAWNAQSEWRDIPSGPELRINLLFNRRLRAAPASPLTTGTPIAAELWSFLPREGRVVLVSHQPIARIALRLPDGADEKQVRLLRTPEYGGSNISDKVQIERGYIV
ncbi:MAG TPA: hypothetical protein VL793_12985, partial [Patescibacteria group bacterium]|nr:hypothetical protein [Patescibacteria group bacterium]